MRRNQPMFTVLALSAVALALGLTACVDEQIVYRDREIFATPPDGAAGFLGYSKVEDKLTVCGNCHIGQQSKWTGTAHADAWESLAANANKSAVCEGCHTVSELGNIMQQSSGWTATKDARYQDVQCESCHGPGLGHVQNPSKATVGSVLAPINTGLAMTTGCAECHTGSHHPYAEEWAASAHGRMPSESPKPRTACRQCHTGEDALSSWGINANFAEKSTVLGDSLKNLPITCAVCHDPHAKNGEGQLRFPVDAPNEEENLCMKCHHKRGQPDLASANRGPHSPEGPILLGYGGWWPPNLEMPGGQIIATHGSERNPKLCAGCHVNQFNYKDATGTTINGTGHTFEAIPCVEAGGKPIVGGGCADSQRTYQTCTDAGCHGSEAVARSALLTATLRMQALTEELDRVLKLVQPNWRTCRGNNSCGAGSPFNSADGTYTTAEGAAFNYDLGVRPDAGIHNPFLIEALLTSTIRQVKTDYNLSAASLVDLSIQLKPSR